MPSVRSLCGCMQHGNGRRVRPPRVKPKLLRLFSDVIVSSAVFQMRYDCTCICWHLSCSSSLYNIVACRYEVNLQVDRLFGRFLHSIRNHNACAFSSVFFTDDSHYVTDAAWQLVRALFLFLCHCSILSKVLHIWSFLSWCSTDMDTKFMWMDRLSGRIMRIQLLSLITHQLLLWSGQSALKHKSSIVDVIPVSFCH